ncbi:hypothetical protein DEO72_LG6g2695 [Vigna unguiculata]|uniref:Uncharacterized protein n=1 Tax=Vigna unguiculata TaxID=3917 RepID=A0A4D6MC51_VIGUN|nr:hypothetical protein DEO72_LG6g2695 [Vigna unguiculata]
MIKTHILDAGIIYALITGKDNSVLKELFDSTQDQQMDPTLSTKEERKRNIKHPMRKNTNNS